VAVFGTSTKKNKEDKREEEEEEEEEEDDIQSELLSFRAHRGWISAVQFLSSPPSENANSIVITSANDKAITLWDINKQDERTKLPKEIFSTNQIHSSGIYSFHELGMTLLTSSKVLSLLLFVKIDLMTILFQGLEYLSINY